MKKHVFGRQFKRDANERKALFKNLLTSLVLEERIRTTEAKSKAIKGSADKLVTKAKKPNAYKNLHADVNGEAVNKLIEEIAPRFAKREGGYTRILRIGKRRVADNAPMVYIEWSEKAVVSAVSSTGKSKKTVKKETKKVKVESTKTPVVKPQEVKSQPKFKEVARKLITRQKKGQ